MKAQYYRYLFQNRSDGIIHTFSIVDVEENSKWNLYYLCGARESNIPSGENDQRFTDIKETIHLLVLAELNSDYVEKAIEFSKKNTIEKVIMPAGAQEYAERMQANQICQLDSGESGEEQYGDWKVSYTCFGEGKEASLVLNYIPTKLQKDEKDCVLTVKPFSRERKCSMCVNSDDIKCGMICSLYNDYDVCKSHNSREQEDYVNGVLLLGTLNTETYKDQLFKRLGDEIGKFRFVSCSDIAKDTRYLKDLLGKREKEKSEINQYFIAPEGLCKDTGVLKELITSSLRLKVILTTEDWGICASGFFVRRNEK